MSNPANREETDDDDQTEADHLERVSDGCGCVEVWEDLSEYRQETD